MQHHGSHVLDGVRVLELGQVRAEPFADAILADLGAEVVKLERVESGDDAGRMGPAFRRGDALNFQVFNHSKQSVAIDLKTVAGCAVFERLAADFNFFRPPTQRHPAPSLGQRTSLPNPLHKEPNEHQHRGRRTRHL